MAIDLERKMENALAARLKQHQPLSRQRIRCNSEDSAKVNQDLIICATRGSGNPPFSGIFDMGVTITLTMKHRRTTDTLPTFLELCAAVEAVLCGVDARKLATQLSLSISDFHCYEIAVTGKDDSPVPQKHSCIWSLSTTAMPQGYDNTSRLQQT